MLFTGTFLRETMDDKTDNSKLQSKMSPQEFAFETRFVVLNYLGQIPSKSSSGSGSSQYASSYGSSSGSRRSYHTQSSSSSGSSHGVGDKGLSISPRPPDGDDQCEFISDSQDQKHLPIKSKGKQSKQRLSVENVQGFSGSESKKAQHSDAVFESYKGAEMEEGRRQISAILQKRSREAKVIQEIKDMTKYSPSDQHLIQPSSMVGGSKSLQYGGDDSLVLSNTSSMRPQALDESQFDHGAGEGLLPDFDEPGLIPHRWLDNQHSLSSDQQLSLGLRDQPSPTRPSRLDGLPDIYPTVDSDNSKVAKQDGEPSALNAGEINEASSPQENHQESHTKLTPRYSGPIIPGTGMPAIPENKTVTDLPPLNWTISKDSEYSDMDSPVSDVSSLTLSGKSAKSKSSVVELNQVKESFKCVCNNVNYIMGALASIQKNGTSFGKRPSTFAFWLGQLSITQ